MKNTNGDDFLEAFRRGDYAAFEHLVETYKDRLYFSALKMLKNREDAEDAVASAFAAAYRDHSKFRGTSGVYTWLWRICFNLCWHHIHKNRIKVFSLDEIIADSAEGASKEFAHFVSRDQTEKSYFRSMKVSWIRKSVRRAILSLPQKHRRVVILRDLMDYSYEEIAVILNISNGTVMSRLCRARASLKQNLTEAGIIQVKQDSGPVAEGRLMDTPFSPSCFPAG